MQHNNFINSALDNEKKEMTIFFDLATAFNILSSLDWFRRYLEEKANSENKAWTVMKQ